jgi:integrase
VEISVPELETSVFVIPGGHVKNAEERLIVLNRVTKVRDREPSGTACGVCLLPQPVRGMNNTAWKSARERAADEWQQRHGEPAPLGCRKSRVHDPKHTFGGRLRAAGVGFEDRQDLLGHRSGRITTHYPQAELLNLIEAADKVCTAESRKSPATTWLRRKAG